MASAPQSILPSACTLGEGPVWLPRDAALWFVDIKAPAIYRFDPDAGSVRRWPAPAQVGWVLPEAGGGLLAGLQTGIHRFDPADGGFTPLHDPEPASPGNRLNDATVDIHGRLWFGSMDDAERDPTGRFYRMDARGCVEAGLPPASITNGPAVSPDGSLLYSVDTLARALWVSRIEPDGTLSERRPFAMIEEGAGHPDGPSVDAEGCVWIGLYGGWAARRYSPSGVLIDQVRFPVANVTKIAFGGPGLATAFATTARAGLGEDDLRAQPLAGDLFAFDAGVRGVETPEARIATA